MDRLKASLMKFYKTVDFKLLFYTKDVIWERTNCYNIFYYKYHFFYHVRYPQTYQKQTTKVIFWVLIMRTTITFFILWRKVLTNLVTLKLSGTHFWCNLKGKWNCKILNYDTKINRYTLQCSYMITKINFWYFNFRKGRNISTGRFFFSSV